MEGLWSVQRGKGDWLKVVRKETNAVGSHFRFTLRRIYQDGDLKERDPEKCYGDHNNRILCAG